uniref:MADF domain-containing protein n=1 Tax=Romanomermis culicivorax TaxID=13658 RepID=A0A915JGK5_ROMCU
MQHEPEVVISSGATGSVGKYDGFNAKLTTRNVEDNIKLIELIKDCPILYDSTLPGYKDTAQKEESWQNIARSMLWPVELCQTRWKSLRDSFRKKDKKIFGGGQDNTPSNSPTWRYRELLSFLRDKNYRRRDHHSDPLSYDSPSLVGRRTISCSDQINFRMSPSDFDTAEDSNHHHLNNDQAAPDYHHLDDSSSCNGNDVKLEIAQNTVNSDLDENNDDSDSRNGVTAAIPVVRDVDDAGARVESPCAGGGVISVVNGISVLDENDRSPPVSDNSPTLNQEENVLAALGLTAAVADGAGENLRTSPSTTTTPSLITPSNSTGVQRISPKSAQRILQALASSSNKRKSTVVNHHSNHNSGLNHHNDSTTMINLKRHKTTSTNSHLNHVTYPNRTPSISHHSPRNGYSAAFPTNLNSNINNNSGQDTVLPNGCCNNNGVHDFFFRKEYDEDDLFGLSIAASLKKCTEDQKLAAKIEIMRILHVAQH